MPNAPSLLFVTTPNVDPWSGAEELWARTALDLVARGLRVAASATEFHPLHPRMIELRDRGVDLNLRPLWFSWHQHPIKRVNSKGIGPALYEVRSLLSSRRPSLVVFSEGNALPPLEMLEFCAEIAVPFVTLMQANKEAVWYPDPIAARYRSVLGKAKRCFFVSKGNQFLSEKQIGGVYDNSEIVHNPVNVDRDISLPWPCEQDDTVRLACVGRLYPPAKGQDILFETLAEAGWRDRSWRLSIYGNGDMRQGLIWLAHRFGLSDRVFFPGFANVGDIWAANHALVMPSRFEGLPLAMVEAMLCGRPVVATDIAGHREIIRDGVTGFIADSPTAKSFGVALERFWEQRSRLREIGNAAARSIREIMPSDPVGSFADKLLALTA